MRYCLKNSAGSLRLGGLLLAMYFAMAPVWAEGVRATRTEGRIMQNGQLAISTRFATVLPEQLADALKQGVPLDFVLTYQLESPTLASYRFKLSHLVSNSNTVTYRLTYHPLTSRYRVSVGTFSSEYSSLDMALRAVGAIANWAVLDRNTLTDTPQYEVKARVRLSLTTSKLPKPFQINAVSSSSWDLDSGWQDLQIRK